MYFSGPILKPKKDPVEEMVMACEKSTVQHKFKEEYTLRDKYFPYIESFIPKTEKILFRYIAQYEDKNAEILNSPYLLKQLEFWENGKDGDIVFKCTNINPRELWEDIRKVPLPGNLTEKAQFRPLQVVLLLIIRYYLITNQPKKMNVICHYYGYSIYWQRFKKHWGMYPPREETMIYTINECTFKVLLKKLGSLKAMIFYSIHGRTDTYREQIVDCCDEDIRYLLDQLYNSIAQKVREVANKYYDNFKNKDVVMKSVGKVDEEGGQRLTSSTTTQVEEYAQMYTTKFFMSEIDMRRVKEAASMVPDVSPKELQATLKQLLDNASIEEVHDFYASLFYIFLTCGDPKADVNAIQSLKFFVVMKDIIRKGNSTDVNIKKTRDIVSNWLQKGSNTYRVTSREPTKSGYRKAVYYYFILSVTNNR